MDFKIYEKELCTAIKNVVIKIIEENPIMNIPSRSRSGAEISDFLEACFVSKVNDNANPLLSDASQAPPGATKNPFDAKCTFEFQDREELIWIDFKACKISSADSNPDIGTPKKVVEFIKDGHFYLVYVIVYYTAEGDTSVFAKFNNEFVKVYSLKDVNHTFRLNPKPQLQVNISAEPEYRTREEFIEILIQKHYESYDRQLKSIAEKRSKLEDLKEDLIKANKVSESRVNYKVK
ncbi:hypothetical protein NY607_16650 [Lysinibacillus sp. A4]|uniref:hypothetical protein n=1 Tax=Lysinibacillus sp. A4 TaxID=2976269 RepID=UPI002175EF8C|nr:hypothetical protein [Lysinibacillus sp. A4]MCS5502752.1 hypothetical protein [Lysinibacillus sp. A4]